MQKIKFLSSLVVAIVILQGCASKVKTEEYNNSAEIWYQKIGDSVASNKLDKADQYFVSLKSEHANSEYIKESIMLLANAHMNSDEYLLATFYYDEYIKRFGATASPATMQYIDFMKIKAAFLGVKKLNRDQKLILDTIENASSFRAKYPNSEYNPLVNSMLIRLQMGQYMLNENIASLYDRTGKPEAAAIYKAKNSSSSLKLDDIEMPKAGIIDSLLDW